MTADVFVALIAFGGLCLAWIAIGRRPTVRSIHIERSTSDRAA
jgi:hypothetical protein